MTDAPRSHSPDIELGTSQGRLGCHLTPCHFMSTDIWLTQPLPSLLGDTRSTLKAPINYPQIRARALIYQVTPTTLFSIMPGSNHPQTSRVSHLLSLPLLCQRRMLPQALQTQTSLKRTMATLPTRYSLSTLLRRTNLIRSSQRAGKETRKGSSYLYVVALYFSWSH
jgi:hypothetical protein